MPRRIGQAAHGDGVRKIAIIIKEASREEMSVVHRIMHEAFEQYAGVLVPPSGALSETIEDILHKIEGRGAAILVWDGLEPVGSARFYYVENYMYIGRVAVLPAHRGKGIARYMLSYLEEIARSHSYSETRVEVRLSLPENVDYYKKLQYQIINEQSYPGGEDSWYTMSKSI
ncbi:GNAT family N-acetyltransferase [Paenibacillus sp. LMG 31456]|uniref:GNAT family N-acetyltransferase n=1 Tax=Paenibacillus foliorum TaxID=2654974 RepID=A0A972K1F9_9BACL|nr:GNAT family N-acetyltransferase [Paenibacillus foliorum]NOU96654.1 GNAT family N-acetyltransferase [Paenibacillus foliorum]